MWSAPMTSPGDGDLQVGFRDVDAAGDSARFVEYLDAATAILRERKLALLEALQLSDGDSAIDVGCGVGDDLVLLAERVGSGGHAIGIDSSANLLAEARSRTAEIAGTAFIQADAHVLPFEDSTFDGAFESICETCTFFQTSIEFRPTLQAQHDHAATHKQASRQQLFRQILSRIDQDAS
jgi:SAM-dependent methyltransferase